MLSVNTFFILAFLIFCFFEQYSPINSKNPPNGGFFPVLI